jgi:hypothetical protein
VLFAVGLRHRHALILALQAWLLRVVANLIVMAAAVGGVWALHRPHPLAVALFVGRGVWALVAAMHEAAGDIEAELDRPAQARLEDDRWVWRESGRWATPARHIGEGRSLA